MTIEELAAHAGLSVEQTKCLLAKAQIAWLDYHNGGGDYNGGIQRGIVDTIAYLAKVEWQVVSRAMFDTEVSIYRQTHRMTL